MLSTARFLGNQWIVIFYEILRYIIFLQQWFSTVLHFSIHMWPANYSNSSAYDTTPDRWFSVCGFLSEYGDLHLLGYSSTPNRPRKHHQNHWETLFCRIKQLYFYMVENVLYEWTLKMNSISTCKCMTVLLLTIMQHSQLGVGDYR